MATNDPPHLQLSWHSMPEILTEGELERPHVERAGRNRHTIFAVLAALAFLLGLTLGIVSERSAVPVPSTLLGSLLALGTIWVAALRMSVIPLVIALLVVSIASLPQKASVWRIGTRALAVFVALLSGAATLAALLLPSLFDIPGTPVLGSPSTSVPSIPAVLAETGSLMSGIASLVPRSPLGALANTALLPLLMLSLALGLALRTTHPRWCATAVRVFQMVEQAMLVVVHWLVALAPIAVFGLALDLGARMGSAAAIAAGKYILITSLVLVGLTLLLYPLVGLTRCIPLREFAVTSLPSQVVAFGSRSSIASFPVMLKSIHRRPCPHADETGIVLPLAASAFKLSTPVSMLTGGLLLAELYRVPLGPAEIVVLALSSIGASFLGAGIPHGGLFVFAPFYLSVGLPAEGVGVLLALDLIPDIFKTVLNVTGIMATTMILTGTERKSVRAPSPADPAGRVARGGVK